MNRSEIQRKVYEAFSDARSIVMFLPETAIGVLGYSAQLARNRVERTLIERRFKSDDGLAALELAKQAKRLLKGEGVKDYTRKVDVVIKDIDDSERTIQIPVEQIIIELSGEDASSVVVQWWKGDITSGLRSDILAKVNLRTAQHSITFSPGGTQGVLRNRQFTRQARVEMYNDLQDKMINAAEPTVS